jgi:hypothetical protein
MDAHRSDDPIRLAGIAPRDAGCIFVERQDVLYESWRRHGSCHRSLRSGISHTNAPERSCGRDGSVTSLARHYQPASAVGTAR